MTQAELVDRQIARANRALALRELRPILVAAIIAVGLILSGLTYSSRSLARERFTMVSCAPELRVCRVFDTWEGEISLIPLPQPPPTGAQEVTQ